MPSLHCSQENTTENLYCHPLLLIPTALLARFTAHRPPARTQSMWILAQGGKTRRGFQQRKRDSKDCQGF